MSGQEIEVNFNVQEGRGYTSYRKSIQEIMSHYVGIVRQDEELKEAKEKIKAIYQEIEREKNCSLEYFEVKNMCKAALEIIQNAMEKDSIGCHYKISDKERR